MEIREEEAILRGLSMPIYSLSQQNEEYGTGFDLRVGLHNCEMYLDLMDDCSKYGKVIKTLKSNSAFLNRHQFVNDIVTKFEKQIYELL